MLLLLGVVVLGREVLLGFVVLLFGREVPLLLGLTVLLFGLLVGRTYSELERD